MPDDDYVAIRKERERGGCRRTPMSRQWKGKGYSSSLRQTQNDCFLLQISETLGHVEGFLSFCYGIGGNMIFAANPIECATGAGVELGCVVGAYSDMAGT